MWLSPNSFLCAMLEVMVFSLKQYTVINNMCLTSCGVEIWNPVKDDAVHEQGGGIDLHGSAQQAVEDPNVPERKAEVDINITQDFVLLQ